MSYAIVPNREQDRAERAEAFYAKSRREFIDRRTDEMMASPGAVLSILNEITDSREHRLGMFLHKAFAEVGHVWDSLTEIQRTFESIAQDRASAEWASMPRCYESDRAADEADFRRSA